MRAKPSTPFWIPNPALSPSRPRRIRRALQRSASALLRLLNTVMDAEDRAALADLLTVFVLISIGVLLASLVFGEALHLFRLVGGV